MINKAKIFAPLPASMLNGTWTKSPYFRWAILGVFIRSIFMAFTVHGDLLVMQFSSHQLVQYGRLIPDVIQENQLVYPTPIYLLMAGFQYILRPIMPYYQTIGSVLDSNALFGWYATPHKFRYLFLLKIHYLPFDFLAAYLLTKLGSNTENKLWIFKSWMISPIIIFGTFAWGQFDIIPTAFMVAAYFAAIRDKPLLSSFLIGLGAAFKIFPLLLLPFVLILWRPNFRKFILATVFGIMPYVLSVLPYLTAGAFNSEIFLNGHALLSIGENQRLFDSIIDIGHGHKLRLYFVWYGLLLGIAYIRSAKDHQISDLWRYALAVFIILYPLVAFHPYWVIWVWPAITIALSKRKDDRWWIWLILSILYLSVAFLNWGKPITTDLLVPSFPSILYIQDFRELISKIFPSNLLADGLRSILLGISFLVIWETLKVPKLSEKINR